MADASDMGSSMASSAASDTSSGGGNSRLKSAVKSAGRSLSASGQAMMSDSREQAESRIGPVSYKRGGKVRKTGRANLHANERVVPANKRKKVERLMKREKMTLTNRKGKKRTKKRSSGRG
jgi:hypothetical protein